MSLPARLFVATALLVAWPAAAQEAQEAPAEAASDEAAANARRFFQAAQNAFAEGRYVEAARSFEEAFRIKPHPAPLINAGDAWEKAGEYALAARSFHRALGLSQDERDRADAVERLTRLKPQLCELKLVGDAALRVRIDEEEFQGGETVFLFPGEHRVTLADVDAAKVRNLTLAAGTIRTIDVATLKPDPGQAGGGAGGSDAADGPAAAGPPQGFSLGIPTIVGYGVALVGAGAAVFFGLQVNDAESSFNEAPNREDYDRFNQNKLLMNISLGVGVIGAGVGTFFLFQDISRSKAPQADTASAPRGRVARRAAPGIAFDVVPTAGGGTLHAAGRF